MNIKQQLDQVIAEMAGFCGDCPDHYLKAWASRLSAIAEQMGAEPVAWKVKNAPGCEGNDDYYDNKTAVAARIAEGYEVVPLYTVPQVPDGMVLVPKEPEEMIDVPVCLNKATMDKLNNMTKRELIEKLGAAAVEAEVYRLRCKTAMEDSERAAREVEKLQTKLDKAEAYVEQGRAMIEAVMERWYEYDA